MDDSERERYLRTVSVVGYCEGCIGAALVALETGDIERARSTLQRAVNKIEELFEKMPDSARAQTWS